jgi:hypothetical protein
VWMNNVVPWGPKSTSSPKWAELMPVPTTLVHHGRNAPVRPRLLEQFAQDSALFGHRTGSSNSRVTTCGSHAALLFHYLEMLPTRAVSLASSKEVASFIKADSSFNSAIVFFSSPRI